MLTMLDPAEIPRYQSPKSPLRTFANETIREFIERAEVGDVAEVTGAPEDKALDAVSNATKLRAALSDEAFYLGHKKHVKIVRRKSRVFLERMEERKVGIYARKEA